MVEHQRIFFADDAGIASVDITTDNSSLCTDAGGVYDAESDSCTVDLTASTWSQQVCEASGGSWYEATGSCGAPRMWSCDAAMRPFANSPFLMGLHLPSCLLENAIFLTDDKHVLLPHAA